MSEKRKEVSLGELGYPLSTYSSFAIPRYETTVFNVVVLPREFSEKLFKIEKSIEELKTEIRELREMIERRLSEMEGEEEVVVLQRVPEDEAKKVVLELIKKKPGVRTSDIIIELGLEPELVLKILDELEKEGKVKGEEVG